MKCDQCKRRVRDSFTDKLTHLWKYHPDHLINRFQQWPQISYKIGEMFGEHLKGVVHGSKTIK